MKRKFKQWWSTIPPISTKRKKISPKLYSLNTKYNLPKDGLSYINLCLTLLFVI